MTGSLLKGVKQRGALWSWNGGILGHTRPIDGADLTVGARLVSAIKGCHKAAASVSGADQREWGDFSRWRM